MKGAPIFFFFLVFSFFCQAQSFSITGNIADANNSAIEFANVILFSEDQSEVLKGTSTDVNGVFELNSLEATTYILKVSFIGYQTYEQKIVLTGDLDLKTVILEDASESLDEITLTAKKPTLSREADRLVFNIEKTALVEGTMLQAIKSTPGVLVLGNEITVKNSSPTVYINNKKVQLSSDDLGQLLEGSSANSITSIEVITNPSARYDAESGVVLNIVMSKNLITGYRGSISTEYMQAVFPRYKLGTSHFFKNKDISFNMNYSYAKNKINRTGDGNINFLNSSNVIEESWRTLSNRNTWSETHTLNTNFDYFISDNSTISLSSNSLYVPYFKYKITSITTINDANDSFLSSFESNNISRDNKYNLGFDLDFRHELTTGSLLINTHFTTYNYERNQNAFNRFFDIDRIFLGPSAFNTNSNQDTQIWSAKLDYSLPLNENSTFETGLKASYINTDSDITQFDVDLDTGEQTIDNLNSDAFDYDEQIYAAYANYALSTDKWSVNAGLRLEKTTLDGVSLSTNQINTQDYTKLFPNASLQYNVSEGYTVKFNYKRSIVRPSYTDLNPFKFFINENYVVVGNPNLVPTFVDHYVVGTTLFDELIAVEAYYKNLDGAISEIPRQDNTNNIIAYQSVNFDKTVEYGFDFALDLYPSDTWNIYAVTSFYNIEEETDFGNGFVTQDQWSNYSELSNTFSLLEDGSLDCSASLIWVGKNLQGFQVVEDRLFSEFVVSKTILNKKGFLTLTVSDLFNCQNQEVSTRYQNQFNSQFVDVDSRFVKLGFRYKFGNTRLETNARTSDLQERERLNKEGN